MGDAKEGFKKASLYATENYDPSFIIIQDDPTGPFYDSRHALPVNQATVDNIVLIGVQDPIIVSEWEGKKYAIKGRQTLKCWREACKIWEQKKQPIKPIPCHIRKVEPKIASIINVSCNEHRRNNDMMEKISTAIYQLSIGISHEDVACANDISVAQLKNWLKVDSLSAPVKKAIESGKIGVTAASKLSDLPATEQKEKLQEIIDSGVKPTAEVTQRVSKGEKASEVKKVKKYSIAELRALLNEYANGGPTEDVRFEALLDWMAI